MLLERKRNSSVSAEADEPSFLKRFLRKGSAKDAVYTSSKEALHPYERSRSIPEASTKPKTSLIVPSHDQHEPGISPISGTEKRCDCKRGRLVDQWDQQSPSMSTTLRLHCLNCGLCNRCDPTMQMRYPRCNKCQDIHWLSALPLDLLLGICDYLDPLSLMLVRLTCAGFYCNLPWPVPPLSIQDYHLYIREFIPPRLYYCAQCTKYHPWMLDNRYTWPRFASGRTQTFCLRDLDREKPRSAMHDTLSRSHLYVCRHCLFVRNEHKCRTCMKCEVCAKVKYSSVSPECMACDAGKSRCPFCQRSRFCNPGCRGCGICGLCAGKSFQSEKYCGRCGTGGV